MQKILFIIALLLFAGDTIGYAQELITRTKNFPKNNAVVTVTQKPDNTAYLIAIKHTRFNDTICDKINKPVPDNIVQLVDFDFISEDYFATISYNVSFGALIYVTYKIKEYHYQMHKRTTLYFNYNFNSVHSTKKNYKHKIINMKNIITYTDGEPEIHWTFDPRRGELVKKE